MYLGFVAGRREKIAAALVALLTAFSATREAGGQPTPQPITKNDYSIEFFQGPLIAPVRVMGISGAYTAVAEGVDGAAVNAASPAVREPYSFDWLDYDIDLGVSFPGSYSNTDFDNSGKFDRINNFVYFNFGAQLQLGDFGTSVTGEFLRYDVIPSTPRSPGLSLTAGRWHALGAYGLANDQIVVGGGLRVVSMGLQQSGGPVPTGPEVLTMVGAAPEAGVLVKPDEAPARFGATVRAPVSGGDFGGSSTTTDAQGVTRAGSLVLSKVYSGR